jgi:anti-sigma factor RsiW
MTCREFIEFFWRYCSGELSAAERSRFDEHLAECPDCVAYLQSYEEAVRLGKGAFADTDAPVPAEVPEELVQAILNCRNSA